MKILIVTAFFPPQNSIASLRPYSWAKYWSLAGHKVTVLTTPKKETSADSPMPFVNFEVIEVPVPWLKFFGRLRQPHRTGVFPAEISSAGISKHLNFRARLGEWFKRLQRTYGVVYGVRMPDPLDLWARVAVRRVSDQTWDLVVSTAGPYSVHAPAYRLYKRGLAKQWIADWRDLWVDHHIFPGLAGFRMLERYMERKWCTAASAITTVSQPLADVMAAKYGNKVSVIFNGFDIDDLELLPTQSIFPDDGVTRIVYTGTIYAGKQDPTPLFQAIAQLAIESDLSPDRLQVLFCGNNADVSEIAGTHGVADFVKYLGFMPRSRALQMQRDADVLLFLPLESDSAQGILTGKLFEYIYSGSLIWSVGRSDDASVASVLKAADCGVVMARDVLKIKAAIIELLEHSCVDVQSATRHKRYDAFIDKYSRREQALRMLKILD